LLFHQRMDRIPPTTRKQLRLLGYKGTPEDLRTFQAAKGFEPTGTVDAQTKRALAYSTKVHAKKPDLFLPGAKNASVLAAEKGLKKLGFDVGKLDGVFDQKLADAVQAFKKGHQGQLHNIGRYMGNPVRSIIARASGIAQPAPVTDDGVRKTPSGLHWPLGKEGTIIGRPYQGTHTRGNWQSDNALDLSVPNGTPVYATADGVIGPRIGDLSSSDPALLGKRLTLETNGNAFYYAHLSKLSVQAGQHVKRGQLLGYSGSANGAPHLHIGVEHGDPQKLFGV